MTIRVVLGLRALTRRLGVGASMSVERRCGRDADSNTHDVTSGAVVARAGDRAIDPLVVEGGCSEALRAMVAALRVGCDCGEGA